MKEAGTDNVIANPDDNKYIFGKPSYANGKMD